LLKSLHISNYALIKDISLQFEGSFTTITGETGAGKSILLGALGLLLGNRADKDAIRDHSKKCIIEAEFDLKNYNLKEVFNQLDLDYEDLTILRRELMSNKSRTFVNDTPVNLKVLQTLKTYLIDIHSQNDSYVFSNPQFQYNILDKLSSENQTLLKTFKAKLKEYQSLQKELQELEDKKAESLKKQDYTQFLFDELHEANLYKGCQEEIEQEYQGLKNAEDIQLLLSESTNILQQEDIGVYDQLSLVNNRLIELSNYLNTYQELKERIHSVYIEIDDIAQELDNCLDKVEVNPEKLVEVERNLQVLNTLLLKHQVNSDEELIQIKENLESELQEYADYDENIDNIKLDIKNASEQLNAIARQLFENRKKSAKLVEKQLIEGLSQLGMQNSNIQIKLIKASDFNSFGKDELEWLFSANVGMPLRPVAKVVSGGEMSRILLVIKSILAKYGNLPCIIFDEIDTGVSGEIALKMAEIMFRMSKTMQVISITHLPQIASKGNQHLKVQKFTSQTHTETQIVNLSPEDRILELAYMLGGDRKSKSAIAHAKNLLN
jgi:DNA repair protein RecN (Recombination protein N)